MSEGIGNINRGKPIAVARFELNECLDRMFEKAFAATHDDVLKMLDILNNDYWASKSKIKVNFTSLGDFIVDIEPSVYVKMCVFVSDEWEVYPNNVRISNSKGTTIYYVSDEISEKLNSITKRMRRRIEKAINGIRKKRDEVLRMVNK